MVNMLFKKPARAGGKGKGETFFGGGRGIKRVEKKNNE